MYGKITTVSMSRRGFTLIELMVVILIISVTYFLVAPPLNRIFDEKIKKEVRLSECISLLRELKNKDDKNQAFGIRCKEDFNNCELFCDSGTIIPDFKIDFENMEPKIKQYLPTPQGGIKELVNKDVFFEVLLDKNGIVRPIIYEIDSRFYVFSSNIRSGIAVENKAELSSIYLNNELLPTNQEQIIVR